MLKSHRLNVKPDMAFQLDGAICDFGKNIVAKLLHSIYYILSLNLHTPKEAMYEEPNYHQCLHHRLYFFN
jgi:hypothetical protein